MTSALKRTLLKAIACSALLILPVLTVWNAVVVSPYWPMPRMDIWRLYGVTPEIPVSWSLQAFLDGTLQKAISNRLARAMPIRSLLVRINNELRLDLFGLAASNIVVGLEGNLVEREYLREYCRRSEGLAEIRARAIIPVLLDIQNYYRSRGAIFVYVISPSKVANMPEKFVGKVSCASSDAARTRFLPRYSALIRESGVAIVDTASRIHALSPNYDVGLFPQGGVHWNDIGAAIASSLIVDEINRQARQTLIPPFTFTHSRADRPVGTDRDLADLLNVLMTPLSYPTPRVEFSPSLSCKTNPPAVSNIAFVGGSFMHRPVEFMSRENCLSTAVLFYYLRVGRYGGDPYRLMRPERPQLDASELAQLRDVQVLVLEENEAVVGENHYFRPLLEVLQKRNTE